MFGRWFGNKGATGAARGNALAGLVVPDSAGVLSCRVLDPVNEPVTQAEFVLTDRAGRKMVGGETDPYGSVMATVPAGSTGWRSRRRGSRPSTVRPRSPRAAMRASAM